MTPRPGTHDLGPVLCDLLLRTSCAGAMARMGHDLTLVVEDWRGTLVLGDAPATSSIRMTADLASLRVREGHGGPKPMTDADRPQIERHAARSLDVAQHPELSFTSTAIDGTWESGRVEGRLTLHGRTQSQAFAVAATETGFRLTGEVVQSRFGITPYSAMMGALRVGDAVGVEVTVEL